MSIEDLLLQCFTLVLCILGIQSQVFPTGCALPSSWTNSVDWYCDGTDATKYTKYTFDASSPTITNNAVGWDSTNKKFTIEFAEKDITVENPCPIVETGKCNELSLYLSSTEAKTDGAPITIDGTNFFGWLQWKCTTTADSKTIYYGFPINLDEAADPFVSTAAAEELKKAFDQAGDDTANPPTVAGRFTAVTEIQTDFNNWNAFGKVDAYTHTYFMMDKDGNMYKAFKNASLTLTKAKYAEIVGVAGTNDGSGLAMAGPAAASTCDKVFKTKFGSADQACSDCSDQKCSSLQISPKMMLTVAPMILLQFFRK